MVNSGAETDFLAFLCAEFATDPITVVTIPMKPTAVQLVRVSIVDDFTNFLILKI
jgi:hypothetical protein